VLYFFPIGLIFYYLTKRHILSVAKACCTM